MESRSVKKGEGVKQGVTKLLVNFILFYPSKESILNAQVTIFLLLSFQAKKMLNCIIMLKFHLLKQGRQQLKK